MSKQKKDYYELSQLSDQFSADMAPIYHDSKKKRFFKQGRSSFLDEFYTMYRKWVKNE
ncbi:MAG: hypothetical protein ACO3K7_07035 [Candidatus Marinamargulisbacteria bacterium]|jgi:hypothetical protein